MKVIQFVLLTLALILPTAVVKAAPTETADAPQEIVGAVGSPMPLIAQSKQDKWELVKVVTDQFSGCATVSGSANISGSYTIIHQLGAAVPSLDGRYSWSVPNAVFISATPGGRPDPELSRWFESTLFSCRSDGRIPQSATRYLICILHEETPGQDKFTDVHLVPAGWQEDVLPAILYLRTYPKLGHPNDAASDWTQAKGLLHSSNPYLVLTALQLLAISKNLTTADMDIALSSSDIKIIASSLVISRLYFWFALDANAQLLLKRVAATQSMNQLDGIALGFFVSNPSVARMYSSPLPDLPGTLQLPKQKESQELANLMPLVRQRLKELDPNGGPAEAQWRTIDNICRMYGV